MIDVNENNSTGPGSPHERRDSGQHLETSQSIDRPYSDAAILYEIPRARSDDPPLRHWWMDDEAQQDGNGSQQNG